jgi:hypothetical protein
MNKYMYVAYSVIQTTARKMSAGAKLHLISRLFLNHQRINRLVTGWTTRVIFPTGISSFTTASKQPLYPDQFRIHWLPGDLFLGVQWQGRESSAEVKGAWSFIFTPCRDAEAMGTLIS